MRVVRRSRGYADSELRSLAGVPSVFRTMRATIANGAGKTEGSLERVDGGLGILDLLNGFKRNEPVEKLMSLKFRSCIAAALLGAGALLVTPSSAMAQSDKNTSPAKDGAKDAGESLDQLIFRNGNKVEGKILSETETTITVKVIFAGISTETTYQKSEILEVKRGAVKPAPKAAAQKKDDDGNDAAKKAADVDDDKVVDRDGKAIPSENLKVYFVPLKGEFGRDLSFASLDQIIRDMERCQPDIVVFQFAFEFGIHGEHMADFGSVGFDKKMLGQAWQQLEPSTDMAELLFRKIESGSFKTKPRMVAWVKKALGGSGFLPCAFPEIYFTSDGLQGGLGGLESLFAGVGDEVAREKQRSLRLARAKGLVELGRHDARYMEAMTRLDYWLSYKLEGGQVVLRETKPDSPDWILLKDDGQEERADSMTDWLRMTGNDYLTFDAKKAQILGWSKGTADTLDDLIFKMGISRNFSILKTKAERVLKARSDEISKAEKNLRDLLDKYRSVRVRDPGGYRERSAARGQRISVLKEMLSIIKRYEREINPANLPGYPGDIEVTIKRIELEQRNDKP